MLIDASRSCLLIVDVQSRLLPAVHEPEALVEACRWMLGVARLLDVPVLVSEQYPKGIGHTVPALREQLGDAEVMEKTHFSCAAEPACRARFEDIDRDQVVVCGIESHVCVLQTAIGLHEQGRQVFVVADAVSSRDPLNVERALARMARAGVEVVSREMAAFEWAHRAGTERFRTLSREYLK